MPNLTDTLALANFTLGVPGLLREPLTIPQARAMIRDRLARRNELFLNMVSRAILAVPSGPYALLLRAAGIEFGDIRALVASQGIEGTLETLRTAGVYVTYSEYKALEPIRRGSLVISVEPGQFDNPLVSNSLRASTGGSRTKPVSVPLNLAHIAATAPHWAVWFAMRGWMDRVFVLWASAYVGLTARYLRCAKFGMRNEKWFSAGIGGRIQDRFVSSVTHGLVRRAAHLPRPEYVTFDQPWRVCSYLHAESAVDRKVCLNTSPSAAVRVSLCAQTHNISLNHVAVLSAGEPLTAARRSMIEASGASAVATYGTSEAGGIGVQCQHSQRTDEVHVFSDAFAVIGHPVDEPVPAGARAFALTALLPSNPKILFNTMIGDYGELYEKDCACGLGALGYRTHMHSIRSFEKLTGEGVTILGADILQVFEQVLVPRFGGSALDYQLIEEQDARGIATHTLRVSPSVEAFEEPACLEMFRRALAEMRALSFNARYVGPGQSDSSASRAADPDCTREISFLLHTPMTAVMDISDLDLIYIGGLPPHPGGSGLSGGQLITGIARRGARVRALAPITGETVKDGEAFATLHPEMEIRRYLVPYFNNTGYLPSPTDYVESQRALLGDLVGAHMAERKPNLIISGHETYAGYVQTFARGYALPAVLWTRGSPTTDLIYGRYDPALAEQTLDTYRGFQAIITPAPHMTSGLTRLGFSNAVTIWNAIVLEQFHARPKPTGLMRQLAINSDHIVVALIGNLTTRKRPRDFVRAGLQALEHSPNIIFLVVGSGSEQNALTEMTSAANADNNFRFVPRVPYEQVPEFFQLADIVVSTSEAEGLARVYLETMASARVLIASDIPAARDIIREHETGFLFPVTDTAYLSQLILRVSADKGLRTRVGENARLYVRAHSLETAVDLYCKQLTCIASN